MVDGSVVAWGTSTTVVGASAYSTYTDITAVVANEGAFAGIAGGDLISYGSRHAGGAANNADRCQQGDQSCLSTAIIGMYATASAFAALMRDATLYT